MPAEAPLLTPAHGRPGRARGREEQAPLFPPSFAYERIGSGEPSDAVEPDAAADEV